MIPHHHFSGVYSERMITEERFRFAKFFCPLSWAIRCELRVADACHKLHSNLL